MVIRLEMSHRTAVLICLLLSFFFFADALVEDRTLIPTGFLYKNPPWNAVSHPEMNDPAQQFDLLYQFYPWAAFFKSSVAEGRFPLWNPYNYLGTPFFANPQTALLFPLTWLHLLLPLGYSFSLIFIIKLAAALVGMYFWLRSRSLQPMAAFSGAVVFGLSMHSVASLAFPYSNVTILLPWLLLSAGKLLKTGGKPAFAWMTLSISLVVLAGQPQSALPAFLAVGLFFLLALREHRRTMLRKASLLLVAFATAAAITSIQWLPSFTYAGESMVSLGPRIIKSGYPYPLGSLLGFLVPDFFGSPLDGTFWGFPGYQDTVFYSSVLALVLAGAAFTTLRRRRILFPLSLVLLAGAIVFGLPLFESLLDLPGFNLMRRNKFVFLLIFGLADLAAQGFEAFLDKRGKNPQSHRILPLLLSSMIVLLTGYGLWWFSEFHSNLSPAVYHQSIRTVSVLILGCCLLITFHRRLAPILFLILLLTDLAWMAYPLNPRGSSRLLYPRTELTSRLDGNRPRVYTLENILVPNTGLPFRIQDVRCYDVMTPRRLFRFMQKIDPNLGNVYDWLMRFDPDQIHANTRMRRLVGTALETYGEELATYLKSESYWSVGVKTIQNRAFFDLLQIRFFLSKRRAAPSGFQNEARLNGIQLSTNPAAKAARLYTDWVEVPTGRALEQMEATDLQKIAVVEARAILSPLPRSSVVPAVKLLRREAESSEYEVSTPVPAVLVEFDRFSPGWKARVDSGPEVPVFPAFHIFRGLFLEPGTHTVEFRYAPSFITYGCVASLAGLMTLVLVAALPAVKRRRKRRLPRISNQVR